MPAQIEEAPVITDQSTVLPVVEPAVKIERQAEDETPSPKLAKEIIGQLMAGLRSSKPTESEVEQKRVEKEKAKEKPVVEKKADDEKQDTEKIDDKKKEDSVEEKKPVKTAKPKPARKELNMGELAETIATASTKAATEAVLSRSEKSESQPKPADRSTTLKTFDELKRIMPEKYGQRDFEAESAEAKKSWESYKSDWKEKNPGEKFDPKADDHVDYREGLEPEYDEDDFRKAEISVTQTPILKEHEQLKREMDELKVELAKSQIAPAIQSEVGNAVNQIARSVVEMVTPDAKGKPVTQESVKQWAEDYPDAVEEIQNAIKSVEPFVAETIKLYDSNGRYKFDANNPVHADLAQFASMLESNFEKADEDQTTLEDGRSFATRESFSRMTPTQQARHWVVGRDELIRAKTSQIASAAAKRAEIIEGRYKSRLERSISKSGSVVKTNGNHAEKKAETTDQAVKTKPEEPVPDGGSRSVSQSAVQGGSGQALTEMQRIAQGWRGSIR